MRRTGDDIVHILSQKLSPAVTYIQEVPGSILGLDTECRDTFLIFSVLLFKFRNNNLNWAPISLFFFCLLFRIYFPLLSNLSKPHNLTDVVKCSKNWFTCLVYYITVSSVVDQLTEA